MITGNGKLLLERLQTGNSSSDLRGEETRVASERTTDVYLYDVFIAHSSEDKYTLVAGLAVLLKQRGICVWYDDFVLKLGDGLRQSIEEGLRSSRFGIVVLSESFFSHDWPQRELDGLAQLEQERGKVILPVWHEVDEVFIRKRAPTLANIVAARSSEGLEAVADKICEAVHGAGRKTRSVDARTPGTPDNWITSHIAQNDQPPPLPKPLQGIVIGYSPGEPISKNLDLKPVGAQTWARLPPTSRAQLRGLAEWLGLNWDDYWFRSTNGWPPAGPPLRLWRKNKER